MNVQTQQTVLKRMLTAMGQDPASEEQLDDPRLNSAFITINKLLMKQMTQENGKTFRIGNFTTDEERASMQANGTRHGSDTHDESEDGAFENFDDEEVIDEKNEGVTGLTDRGTFQQKSKNDKSREETKSSW